MNLKTIFLNFSAILTIATTYGQSAIEFSVHEAQAYAIENNLQLQNARQDVNIAEQQYKETRGQGLPQVDGTLDYMTNFNYEAEIEFGGGASSEPPTIDYTQLDAGDMELMKLLQGFTSSSTGGSTIVMEDQSSATVQISQLIFGGQYWVGLQTSRIGKELARQQVNITELDVKQSVANIYQLILVTEKITDVLTKNLENLRSLKVHTKNMYEAGIAEQTDVDQIAVSISQLENQYKSMKRNINLSYNRLRFQLGLESDQEITLTDSLNTFLKPLDKIDRMAESFDITKNPNYQMIKTQKKLQEKMVDMEKWAYAPTLTGFYSYTEKIMTTGFDLSPNNAAGLNLSIPIFSSGIRKAKVEKAKIELDKANRSKEMLEEQLKLQNNQLRFEFASAFDNYTTQKENVQVARRILKNMQDKYKQGVISTIDLTQANSNYLEAESTYLNAVLELMQADLNLKKLYNNL
ncbi:outer membrane channel protein [Salinivirga cyanobacteriivorans]|uniref:Outer membrane channel protein n=1 Tax=Salinivirga cyanobacteriivorans TaxID=1307839 RepID=A0A0S2I0L7_9BACT|nr:TolC family protein [Salinivirga cyanobacteriivorans]ALO15840.1 outer membrane channel protein [Salinivirga cyanobacteriivorans]